MRAYGFLGVLLATAAAAAPAAAQDGCQPSEVLTSVDMRVADDGRMYVPVKFNDTPKSLLVDTGGFFSEITRPVVKELGLETRHTKLTLIGVSGDTTNVATRTSFTFGNLHADAVDFMVIPDANGLAEDIPDVGGILAPNLMHSYDVEIDFSTMKISFHSQDHCDGRAVPWPANTVSVIPMTLDSSDHIQVPVKLDGQDLTAILDTGATNSVLNLELAQSTFGLTLGDADTPEFGRLLRSPSSRTYTHRFKSLALEGISVPNPTVHIIPDLMRNRMADPSHSLNGGSRLPAQVVKPGFGDLIIGMNIIRHWRLYIAYKEQKLYLAPSPVVISFEPTGSTDQPAAVQGQPKHMAPASGTLQGH